MGRIAGNKMASALPDLAPGGEAKGATASPVEKLPQDVVHWLTVLLGGGFARHRWRRRLGLGGFRRHGLGRGGRGLRRGARVKDDAALAARPAALAGAALIQAAQAVLQQIANRCAELAAKRTSRLRSALSVGPPLLPAGRAQLASEQAAYRSADACTLLAEQALAHLLQLRIGRVGIVEDALHLRIDPRAHPWTFDHHGNAEADRVGEAALAFGGHHQLRLDAE